MIKTICSSETSPCFHAGFLLRLFFDPEDVGDMFLRNVAMLSRWFFAPLILRHWKCRKYVLPKRRPAFTLVSSFAYSSSLMIKTICSSETSPCFHAGFLLRFFFDPEDVGDMFLRNVVLLSRWFIARLILLPWRWRQYVPPKRQLTLNGLHGVIFQKIVLFITSAVRTSNPTI
jgi:hypothetical protein